MPDIGESKYQRVSTLNEYSDHDRSNSEYREKNSGNSEFRANSKDLKNAQKLNRSNYESIVPYVEQIDRPSCFINPIKRSSDEIRKASNILHDSIGFRT